VRLKVTGEEQEMMRQGIEKKQETKSTQNSVTVMFHDRKDFLGVSDSFRARGNAASSLSDALTVGFPVVSPVPSLPSNLKVSAFRAHSRHRTRRRTSPHIEKFSAEVLNTRSAWFVFGASPNSLSQTAAANPTITITEQRRCAAA
jgi:hypothetical protein